MDSIWLLKLKLSNKFREGIENYLISMNATITSLDAENNPNELKPELYDTSAFFIKKPEKYIIKQLFLNFNIKPQEIVLKKVKIQDIYKNNSRSLDPISIGPFNFLDHKKRKQLTEEHLAKLKINVQSADQKVEELSGGQRQAVAIARATAFNAKIVLMDEPTAALAVKEVGKVLDLILNLKKLGVSVIVISHRMDDIFTVCDRVMALFQGTNFAESELKNTSRDEVIGWIMGKKD